MNKTTEEVKVQSTLDIETLEDFIETVGHRVKKIVTVEGKNSDSLDQYIDVVVRMYLGQSEVKQMFGELGAVVVVDQLVEMMVTAVISALLKLDAVAEKYVNKDD